MPRLKQLFKNEHGFSLIEAMIAMVILSIGLMAVGLMQIGAMRANTSASNRGDGMAVAQSTLDRLRGLPLDDTLLADNNSLIDAGSAPAGGVPDDTLADHSDGTVIGSNGQSYTVFWNITDNAPVTGAKTIRLFVYWTDQRFGLNRVISTSVIGGLYL
jgi:type IV pilus assembly protein PilV